MARKRKEAPSPVGAGNKGRVEVLLDHSFPVPQCEHGPTLLFKRHLQDGREKSFFACAVFRERKGCPFYVDITSAAQKSKQRAPPSEPVASRRQQLQLRKRCLREIRGSVGGASGTVRFCSTCSLFVDAAEATAHRGHSITFPTRFQLKNPSTLLQPLANKSAEAQFWFSESTVQFLSETIQRLDCDAVLCIGTPRLFERLIACGRRAFLLDFDERYTRFWTSKRFARYSMYADHVFTASGRRGLRAFLAASRRLVVCVDPPFGGLTSPLLKSVAQLRRLHQEQVHARLPKQDVGFEVMIMFPYFLGRHLAADDSSLQMLPYKVTYDNHPDYAPTKTSCPVRIFTTVKPSLVEHPTNADYTFCAKCDCYVSEGVDHCDICAACVSPVGRRLFASPPHTPVVQSGRSYVHCEPCGRCVKATFAHCRRCRRCHASGACRSQSTADEPHAKIRRKSRS